MGGGALRGPVGLGGGVYGHGMHDYIIDELEIGARAAMFLDSENNCGWSALWDLMYEMDEGAGMNDREIPWGDLTPTQREQQLKLNRALFEDPDWLPPEGMTVHVSTVPVETFDAMMDEDIDDMVGRWHDTNGAPDGRPVELREYLGMTWEQYGEWLRDPT